MQRMKKILILLFILAIGKTELYSQSEINLGVGVGQQFGMPGIRLGYKWKRIEGSVNGGVLPYPIDKKYIPKNYSRAESMDYCMGIGLGFKIKSTSYISYTFGTIFFKNSDKYNITTTLQNVHTLCMNYEIDSEHVRWRFGYGIGYSKKYETIIGPIYPLFTLGCSLKIWKGKSEY